MSYINDALRKAQKDNKSFWISGMGITSSSGKKPDAWQKWYTVIGLSLVFLFAAGIIVALYWSDISPEKSAVKPVGEPFSVAVSPETAPAEQVQKPELTVAKAPALSEAAPLPDPPKETNTPATHQPSVSTVAPMSALPEADTRRERDVTDKADDVQTLYAKALEKQYAGQLREAKELYRRVIRLAPDHLQALNNLGVVYMKLKVYRWAIIRLNNALAIKSDYVDAHYNLACVYAQMKQTDQSLRYLKNAIDLNPDVRSWAAQDEDLRPVSGMPEFQTLMRTRDN